MTDNQIVVKIERTAGRRWAIADIHACPKTLAALIEQIGPGEEDQIFFLGDYINRGPDGAGVIDFILKMKEEGLAVYTLRGNHEDMLLDSHYNSLPPVLEEAVRKAPRPHKALDLRSLEGKILPKYLPFFENLPYCFDIDGYYLVHAGLNFEAENPLTDYDKMIWIRDFTPDLAFLKGKKVVFGHTRRFLEEIREAISENAAAIPLDNGCYDGLRMKNLGIRGNLCALNLDTLDLLVQPNCE